MHFEFSGYHLDLNMVNYLFNWNCQNFIIKEQIWLIIDKTTQQNWHFDYGTSSN